MGKKIVNKDKYKNKILKEDKNESNNLNSDFNSKNLNNQHDNFDSKQAYIMAQKVIKMFKIFIFSL